MVYDGTQFGLWIKERRKARDLTQRELAWQIGCSEFTLRKFEAGTRRPSRQIVERLAHFFGSAADEQSQVMRWARLGAGRDDQQPPDALPGDGKRHTKHNLPSRLTRLIGRERELAEAARYLSSEGVRLLTLSGPPGVGKTRLGVQVATDLLAAFEDGVYFVGLALVRDRPMLFAAIAQALGHKPPSIESALSEVEQILRDKHMLLVLDNFEQVAHARTDLVHLLEVCPGVKALVTSREALHVRGEQQLAVPTLPIPNTSSTPSPELLMANPSVALLMDRASAARADFRLTRENAAQVAAICRKLDGLPLALELAAAQVKVLSPGAILARLDHSMALLVGGPYDLPPRHQALRAAIDWSYDLLSPRERELFACLSVFAGGCDLEAVEAVCGDFTLLKSLLDKSLVQQAGVSPADASSEPRFYMLETIREHSRERLEESGHAGDTRTRHATHYLRMAETAEAHVSGEGEKQWLDRLEVEHGNVRAALDWALGSDDYELAARIAGNMIRFWDVRGYWSEGRHWLDRVLAHLDAVSARSGAVASMAAGRLAYLQDDIARSREFFDVSLKLAREAEYLPAVAQALGGLAYLAARKGERADAVKLLEQSLAVSRELGDTRKVASILANLGRLALETGDTERAETLEQEALTIFRELHDKLGMASTLENLGQLAAEKGDFALSISTLEESLALSREIGDKGHIAWVLGDLGIASLAAGDYALSMTTYREASDHFLELGDKSGLAMAHYMRGVATLYSGGDLGSAASHFNRSIQICREIGDEAGCAPALDGLAFIAADEGDPSRAARLAGAAEMLRAGVGYRAEIVERHLHERVLANLTGAEEAGHLETLLSEGRSMDFDRAIDYATS